MKIEQNKWRKKLEKPQQAEVKLAPEKWIERYGGEKMLISTPKDVDTVLRSIPEGKIMTTAQLRAVLA